MKILFIGPYKQHDGWGSSARALIKSLLTTNVDITLRHIVLAPGLVDENNEEWNKIFKPLEKKYNNHYDVIIQNTLPELFSWTYKSKNIGMFCSETLNLQFTPWMSMCNIMDEIWVHSMVEKTNLCNSGCTSPISVIGSAIDITKFNTEIENKKNIDFTFYTIGDGERKNLNALLLAFHTEFHNSEPVQLLIKTHTDVNALQQTINNYKNILGIYSNLSQYKQEILITQNITETDLINLHKKSDCFVMPSHGEAWCRPALDAVGFGKTPIVTDGTGMADFVDNANGWLVPGHLTPVLAAQKPLPYIYTSREEWIDIDIPALKLAMREAYENKELKQKKAEQGIKDIQYYSYENLGKRLYEKLCP